MRARTLTAVAALLAFATQTFAQTYDLVVQGGSPACVHTPQGVLIFMNSEATVDAVIASPLVMIASDRELGHPRAAGTYSRILAHNVRDAGALTLMDAIRKMSLMPAQRLEKSTPDGARKGRLEEGADADLIVFNPATVAERATYASRRLPSVGMQFEIVGGTVLIDHGKLVPNTYPGAALLGHGRE